MLLTNVIQGVNVVWQAFGCVASMFVISPKLTGLMAIIVTAIVGVGSLFGSALRQLSRTSQAQVLSAFCRSWGWHSMINISLSLIARLLDYSLTL